jgi:hypothetical protein
LHSAQIWKTIHARAASARLKRERSIAIQRLAQRQLEMFSLRSERVSMMLRRKTDAEHAKARTRTSMRNAATIVLVKVG